MDEEVVEGYGREGTWEDGWGSDGDKKWLKEMQWKALETMDEEVVGGDGQEGSWEDEWGSDGDEGSYGVWLKSIDEMMGWY